MTPIQSFLADPQVTELAELCKTSDSLLSLFDLLENQHSNLLAWCLSPNEGHGLGDSVIKDLLLAASIAASERAGHTGQSNDFLKRWSPGRIRGTSFGSAFVVRELGVSTAGDKVVRKGRLDLFIVDPVNRVLVVIENKTGSALTGGQLNQYEQAVKEDLQPLRSFQDFDCLLLVLDQWLDTVPSTAWIGVDYSFLEPSATKAKLQLSRGNPAAKLVLDYCRQHTDWASEEDERIDELSTSLALAYPGVMAAMKVIQKQSIKDWADAALASDQSDLALFTKQHSELVARLVEKSGIAAVASRILRASAESTNDALFEQGRTWANFGPTALGCFQRGEDDYWPVYLNLYRHSDLSSDGRDMYVARLGADPTALNELISPESFIATLKRQFPKVRATSKGAHLFTTLGKGMDAETAIKFVSDELRKLNQLLLASQSELGSH